MANFMLFDVEINWLVSAFRLLFAFLDAIVYSFIAFLFRAIFNLANFELIGFYEILEQRVYVILGIFMLFKVTISIITYLVNPDKLSDKEQGVGKLVTRILTVLIMLIALPTVFSLMTEFQNKVLPVIPRVIMGTNSTLKSEDVSGIVTEMSTTMLDGFAHAKEGCGETKISDPWQMLTHINDPCNETDQKHIYKYDYLPIVSTVVGVLMCYVLFSLSISVAIRAFKLIILRMLAPVPVVSYIDPKSSKDGMFSKWTKTFINVWAELFIHIGLIYFIVYIIDFLLSGQAWLGFFDGLSGPWAVIDGIVLLAFLIIGLLMFARSAPKFIMDALGIKSTGSFAKMLGMGAAALGGIGAARSAFRARQEYDQENRPGENHRLRNLGASLFNGLGAVATGGNAVLSSDKPNLMTGYDAQAKSNATMLSRINAGSTLGGRLGAMGQMLIAGETTADMNERVIKNMEAFNKALGAIGSRAKDEMVKQDWTQSIIGKQRADGSWDYFMNDTSGSAVTGAINYKDFMARKNAAASSGLDKFEIQTTSGMVQISMADAERYQGLLLKGNESNYIERTISGGDHEDAVMVSLEQDANEKSTIPGFKVTDRDSVKQTQDQLNIDTTKLQRDNVRHVANRRGQGNKGN